MSIPTNPPGPDGRAPRARSVRALACGLRGAIRFAWLLFVLGLGAMLYLWVVGLPDSFTDRILARIDSEPFQIAIDRLGLDPTEGIVAGGVYVYRDRDFSEPLARAADVTLLVNWRGALRGGPLLRAVRIRDGALRLPPWGVATAEAPDARLGLTGLRGEVRLDRELVEVPDLEANLFGIVVQGTGALARGAAAPARNVWRDLAAFLDALQNAPPGVPSIVNELNGLRFAEPARASIRFFIDPARPEAWEVEATVDTGAARVRGADFDSVRCEAVLRGYSLRLPDATFGARGRRCHLTGALDLATRIVEARLYSDLPPEQWIAMMPKPWQRHLRAAGIVVDGSMRSEVWTGPVRLDEVAHAIGGWVALERAAVRGVWMEKGYCSIAVSSNTVTFGEIAGVVGRSSGRGPIEGSVVWQRGDGRVDGSLALTCDPNELVPMLTSNQAPFVRRFAFAGAPPRMDVRFTRTPDAGIEMEGHIAATNLAYRGVGLSTLSADLLHSNHVLALHPLVFTRPEGETRGTLVLDFSNHLYEVAMDGAAHPHAIGGILGPRLHEALSAWRFDGPVRMSARGRVDGENFDDRTDLVIDAEAWQVGRSNWMADRCSFTLDARGGRYLATNIVGEAYGGTFTAALLVEADPLGTGHVMTIGADFTNAALARLAARRTHTTDAELEGLLSGFVVVSGIVENLRGPATAGHGALRIDHGALFRLPLLGGLSKVLSMIYPGLGFASQTDLHCTFVIEDGAVRTEDARMEGDVLSMRAEGRYEFTGKVRFNVEVQLLRRGPVAAVLRFVTMPVTKLLEVQLSGTVDDPKWRPVNLPKELFLIFE